MSSCNLVEIEGVQLIESKYSRDFRGSFVKFQPDRFLAEKWNSVGISINPKVGTIRGLHFQVDPFAEEKVISCIQGSAFEVIVDIRPNSKSFGKVATLELSKESARQIYLPKGIAHGFQTLMPDTILHYFLTSEYSPEHSYSIDPFGDLEIDWPKKARAVSEKDAHGLTFELAAQQYASSTKI
jgi:dTDP-4-dehydrorhamnose 3,5-epimerase